MSTDNDLNLWDFMSTVLKYKNLLAVFVIVGGTLALIYAVFTTPIYSANVVTKLNSPLNERGSRLSGALGSAASLAGISLGGAGSDKERFLETIKSRALKIQFAKRYAIARSFFPTRWDPDAKSWRDLDPGIITNIVQSVRKALANISGDEGWIPLQPEPTDDEIVLFLDGNVMQIQHDQLTDIVTISFSFRNPSVAAEWANNYVDMANSYLRNIEISEAGRAMRFLENEVNNTNVAELREMVFQLMQTQLERTMMANSKDDFALTVIDPATPPQFRSHPPRAALVFLGLLFGAVIGVIFILSMDSYFGYKKAKRGGPTSL